MVVRLQLQSIADEVVGQLTVEEGRSVGLDIESSRFHSLTENAFLDALQKRHLTAMSSSSVGSQNSLNVLLLDLHIGYTEIGAGLFERTSRTVVEARIRRGENEAVRRLERTTTDSTKVREDENEIARAMSEDDTPSFIDRTLLPVAVIAGAMVIVYLFFTVRSCDSGRQ